MYQLKFYHSIFKINDLYMKREKRIKILFCINKEKNVKNAWKLTFFDDKKNKMDKKLEVEVKKY